ncbi:MAG: hypothetical protein IKC91_03720 [Clostridia bacterium]|nr:hypothetical protein [Clostridia bacterium]
MQIGFITDGKLVHFQKRRDIRPAHLYCFAFGSIGEVNYEKEVCGESAELEEVALFSRNFNCTVIAGCYTDTKGIKRKSAVVAEKGKILGISDMTTGIDGDIYKCGSGIRVYDTSVGKIGVLVGQDIYFPELFKSLAQCGSEQIVCLYESVGDSLEQILLRANAFCYGVPICMCAHGYVQIADVSGKIAYATPLSPSYFNAEPFKEYHLIETRLRGFHKPQEIF